MSRKSTSRFPMLGLSILSILVMILTACGPTGTPQKPSQNDKPVKGGTWISDIIVSPSSLIPNRSTSAYSAIIMQALYAAMLYSDSKGQFHTGLLTEIPSLTNGDISADYKTWKLKFRDGVKWSDGEPLTAEDEDFTWKLFMNPAFGAQGTSGYEDIVSSEVSADKLTLTLHLKRANAAFITVLVDSTFGAPLPKHAYEKLDPASFDTSPENHKPSVVSGPFMVKSSDPKKEYDLVPNPNWFLKDEGPYLDELIFRTGIQGSTILQEAGAGSVTSTWNVDPLAVEDYNNTPNYKVVIPSAGGFEGLFFNMKSPALKDVVVRQAIAMAVDRATWVERVRKNLGKPNCTSVPSTIPSGYDPNAPCPEYDIDGAKKLLDDNGWKVGSDGVRSKNGVRLEFPLIYTNSLEWRHQSMLYVSSQLQQIGIKGNVTGVEGGDFFAKVLPEGDPAKYGVAEFGFTLGFDPDPSGIAECKGVPTKENGLAGQNFSFYCNPDLDKLFTKELAEVDTAKRQAIFVDINKILLKDLPFVGLAETSNAAVVKNTAHNYDPAPMGSFEAAYLWKWWCTNGKC